MNKNDTSCSVTWAQNWEYYAILRGSLVFACLLVIVDNLTLKKDNFEL